MKKSQTSAGGIAVFIILIALFMVLYLIFIPPADREELLGLNQTSGEEGSTNEGSPTGNSLLSQNPGILKPNENDESKHEIDTIQLYLKNEPITDDLASSITVSKTAFKTETKELRFNVEDLQNLDKVTLYFFVNEAKGDLIITLNGIEIFNAKARGLQTVILPRDLLTENNVLIFRTSSPSFFSKNIYTLGELKVKEDFELTNQKEERSVVLTASETGKGELSFFVFCNQAPTGSRLRIFLNQEEIFNNVISCVSAGKVVEIEEDLLDEGSNTFLFEIDKGDFLINDIELKVDLEEGGSRTYRFSLTEIQMNTILNDPKEVKLTMDFSNDKQKRAIINVNGNEFSLETSDIDYGRFITSLVKEGNNFIRIEPENEFIVDLLEVRIV